MKFFKDTDLPAFEIGSAILGSGGGGDPTIFKYAAHTQLEQYGPVRLLKVDELKDEDLVVPLAFIGAPSVGMEMLPSGYEFETIISAIEKYLQRKPTVIMPAEIGGSNAFVPLQVGGKYKLPILDADGIGRAFPEIQMSSFNLFNIPSSPAILADGRGNVVLIELKDDASMMEAIARNVSMAMGSSAAIAIYLMTGKQAREAVAAGSISRALEIGTSILDARAQGIDPINNLVEKEKGFLLGTGIVEDIDQKIVGGFLKGKVRIEDSGKNYRLVLEYQNEHLVAYKNNKPVACTPDIITMLDAQTGQPITVESMNFGMRVSVIAFPGEAIWMSKRGLNLVGPRAFNYDFDYFAFHQRG